VLSRLKGATAFSSVTYIGASCGSGLEIRWRESTPRQARQNRRCHHGPGLAYKGGISYMGIPFNEVEWSNAVKWFPGKPELQAPVREFLYCTIELQNEGCAILAEGDKRGWLKFDREDKRDIQSLKCIVVGRARERQ
jgi:hypothetical protein